MNALAKVILDTNIFISALISQGNCRKILEVWNEKKFDLYVTAEILREIKKVGERQAFRTYFSLNQLNALLRFLKEKAVLVKSKKPIPKIFLSTDPDDQIFVAGILASKADYFVTGNPKHFPRKIRKTRIVSAKELLTFFD